jgi:hypothetical protein
LTREYLPAIKRAFFRLYCVKPLYGKIMATSSSPPSVTALLTLVLAIRAISSPPQPSEASNYPLEILQPKAGLTTTNRFYKAYPGLEYNVRMGVIGGLWPFNHQLTTAPSGMTINAFTGEITWASPLASGTPYSVTATVTDAENTVQTVSWTISVTTAGFIFVDAVNGTANTAGGAGTVGNPWKTLKDVYGGDTEAAFRADHRVGEFVYWRAGTYDMDAHILSNGSDGLEILIRNSTKPMVWLGHPSDTKPVFNMASAHLYFEGSSGGNIYLDSLDVRAPNARAMGIKIASSKNNVVLRRNKFSGIVGGTQGGNNALVFINLWGEGQNYVFQDNEFTGVDRGYGILNYRTTGVLVENNFLHAIGAVAGNLESHAVGMKVLSRRWDVRDNLFRNNGGYSIWEYYGNALPALSGSNEISYNVIEEGGGTVGLNTRQNAEGDPIYVHRNTILANLEQGRVDATNGPFYWYKNVIINSSVAPDKMLKGAISAPERLIIENNLTGTAAEGIVDASGNLTAAYAEFIGNRGHQVVRN